MAELGKSHDKILGGKALGKIPKYYSAAIPHNVRKTSYKKGLGNLIAKCYYALGCYQYFPNLDKVTPALF